MELYKIPYKYKNVHECRAIVFCCIDFRFWRETMNFVEKNLGIESYDFTKLPGSVKTINESENKIPISCVEVSCKLHKASEIILINHSDCGAYGGLSEFGGDRIKEREFHFQELRKAKDILAEKFPEKEIKLFYAGLNEDESEVEFIEAE